MAKNATKKILFIEDETALQQAVGKVLRESGYEVLSAMDGEEGLANAKSKEPDLILLDLILPRKDGFALLEELKKNPETRRIPVLVLSNLGENAQVERALSLGADAYMVKTSYRLHEVVEKIKAMLGE